MRKRRTVPLEVRKKGRIDVVVRVRLTEVKDLSKRRSMTLPSVVVLWSCHCGEGVSLSEKRGR
jgi:hypothetical protein